MRVPATTRNPLGGGASALRLTRVMIVDDSIIARTVLTRMVESEGDITVAAVAATAEQAIDALKTVRVDAILLDLDMPGMGGLEAIPKIISAARGACVLVVSSLTVDGAEQTLAALALWAADTLPKPISRSVNGSYTTVLLEKIRGLGRVRPRTLPAANPPGPHNAIRPRPVSKMHPGVLAIGASTGGIHALSILFRALPRDLGIPILVTQHLPISFMSVFARQLSAAADCEAVVAEDEMKLLPSRIVIAPGDAHLTIRKQAGQFQVRLDRTPAVSGCMPSVDPMFASVAEGFGENALGIVLSGMGRDGADGAARIVEAGGLILAQDEASCAVWGMPRAIAEANLASDLLPPDQIASRIAASVSASRCK